MIKAVLIFNTQGKPRFSKFYQHFTEDKQQQVIKDIYVAVSARNENMCNFLDGSGMTGESGDLLVYRNYATLYFVICIDSSENQLEVLDLIQVFVEILDKCFGNVCELDIVFHFDKVHYILNEVIFGGMVLYPDVNNVVSIFKDQDKIEKTEVPVFYREIR